MGRFFTLIQANQNTFVDVSKPSLRALQCRVNWLFLVAFICNSVFHQNSIDFQITSKIGCDPNVDSRVLCNRFSRFKSKLKVGNQFCMKKSIALLMVSRLTFVAFFLRLLHTLRNCANGNLDVSKFSFRQRLEKKAVRWMFYSQKFIFSLYFYRSRTHILRASCRVIACHCVVRRILWRHFLWLHTFSSPKSRALASNSFTMAEKTASSTQSICCVCILWLCFALLCYIVCAMVLYNRCKLSFRKLCDFFSLANRYIYSIL